MLPSIGTAGSARHATKRTTLLYIEFDRQATFKLLLHLQSSLAIDSKI